MHARVLHQTGQPCQTFIARGLELTAKVLNAEPLSDRALAIQGALHRLAAVTVADEEAALQHRERGARDLDLALRQAPWLRSQLSGV
jgi:hypothetical protein